MNRMMFVGLLSISLLGIANVMAAASIQIEADYSNVINENIPDDIFGLNVTPGTMPSESDDADGYAMYKNLVTVSGVKYLKIPGDAYHNRYDWLTGEFYSYGTYETDWKIDDWKKFSDDTGVGIYGIIDPYLYFEDHGDGVTDPDGNPPGGNDPGAIIRWAKASGWDQSKWNRWVIGCETYGDWDKSYVSDPNLYAEMVNEIVPKMKAEAQDIQVGIVCEVIWKPSWCGTVLQLAEDNVDFVNFHWYPHDGWEDPYGTMQQYPWLSASLVPKFDSLFDTYIGGRKKPIVIGEYDFWRMDAYGPELRRNTTLATALAWGDFLGVGIGLGFAGASGYDFVSGSSYGQLLSWDEMSLGRPVKYRPTAFAMGLWSKYFGSKMVGTTVTGSDSYVLPNDGRQDWANVDSGSYTAIPVNYVTAYAGLTADRTKATLILINKHNDNSYDLTINLSGVTVDGKKQSDVHTLTTENAYGLMASNRQYDSDAMEVLPPSDDTMETTNPISFTIGPHSMVAVEVPISDAVTPQDNGTITASGGCSMGGSSSMCLGLLILAMTVLFLVRPGSLRRNNFPCKGRLS